MAEYDRALLEPSLQGAEAVTVGVPGRQDPSHGALGCSHLFQNHGGVLLQLLHLLTDVVEICSWGTKRNNSQTLCQSKNESMNLPLVHLQRADLLEYFSESCFSLWIAAFNAEGSSFVFTSSCVQTNIFSVDSNTSRNNFYRMVRWKSERLEHWELLRLLRWDILRPLQLVGQ